MVGWSESDLEHMRAALAEARLAAESGEVPVGAVVVAGGEVIDEVDTYFGMRKIALAKDKMKLENAGSLGDAEVAKLKGLEMKLAKIQQYGKLQAEFRDDNN